MSWQTGAELFTEMWPLIRAKIKSASQRKDFLRELLPVFLRNDVDPHDLEDVHVEVARALAFLEKQSGKDAHDRGPG